MRYLICCFFVCSTQLYSQGFGSTKYWLEDLTTIAFSTDSTRFIASGIRILIEPKLGWVQSTSDRNPIENNVFGSGGIGFETNLIGSWVGGQVIVFAPSEIQYSLNSDLRSKGKTINSDGRVKVGIGFGFGLSLMNGIISLGYSTTGVSSTEFFDGNTGIPSSVNSIYLNIQPVSLIKNLFTVIKK